MLEITNFMEIIQNKKIVVFGTGATSTKITSELPLKINYYVDNEQSKWDKVYNDSKIYNPTKLLSESKSNIAIIVASMFYEEIAIQLINMDFIENEHFWNGNKLLPPQKDTDVSIDSMGSMTTETAIYRERARETVINTVIDIGASDGRWSKMVFRHYSSAFYFLVEAQEVHRAALEKMKTNFSSMDYILAAAGDKNGNIYFNAGNPFGGVASYTSDISCCVNVPMVTIDYCVSQKNLKPPFLLKLDTHGFEVPIIEGANETLKQTNIIIIEVYNFKITKNSLRFYEMCAYLEKQGFLLADICDPMRRSKDKILWQMDFVFISKNRDEFKYNTYEY